MTRWVFSKGTRVAKPSAAVDITPGFVDAGQTLGSSDTRAIAVGTGAFATLELEHVPITADVREGDVLVSSGLGGRFPVGYPVGTVISAVNDNALGFKRVVVQPSAALDRSRHVLVVFQETRT